MIQYRFALAVDGILHTYLELAGGGAVEWKSYFLNTDIVITWINLYLRTSIFVLIGGALSNEHTSSCQSIVFLCEILTIF